MLALPPPRAANVSATVFHLLPRDLAISNWLLHLLPQHPFQTSDVLPPEASLFSFVDFSNTKVGAIPK